MVRRAVGGKKALHYHAVKSRHLSAVYIIDSGLGEITDAMSAALIHDCTHSGREAAFMVSIDTHTCSHAVIGPVSVGPL
jgi:hypothetical protein